jgi:2-polyprenyl-3-methyl-5-hydroxy-6-metoxy-1,4-benzoquinol methylase
MLSLEFTKDQFMTLGKELLFSENLSFAEKSYIRVFGVPINGLRIRARRILPLITNNYKRILDAGCGLGIFTFEVARRFPESLVTGIDIDKKLVESNTQIAKKADLKNCFFEFQDITQLHDLEKFDLILSVDNLEHIQDDDSVLRNFHTALKNGGTAIVHVPGLYRRWYFFGWAVNFKVQGHVRPGYAKEDIVKKIETAGFAIRKAYYTYGWIETITNNISYWITRAEMKNKFLYALVFPVLNFLSYFGKNSRPRKGAGVLVIARKNS